MHRLLIARARHALKTPGCMYCFRGGQSRRSEACLYLCYGDAALVSFAHDPGPMYTTWSRLEQGCFFFITYSFELSGHAVVTDVFPPPPSPRYKPAFVLIAHRWGSPFTPLVDFHRILVTGALGLSATKKKACLVFGSLRNWSPSLNIYVQKYPINISPTGDTGSGPRVPGVVLLYHFVTK